MLTNDEAELYDRQIRLWGLNAQTRLRQSRVLMIGFGGVASEVAKILVLAGIKELTIVDDEPLNEADLYSNLFCRPIAGGTDKQPFRTHQVVEKLRTLNPQVKVNIDNSSTLAKEEDFYSSFDLVTLHSFLPTTDIFKINHICREKNIKFYMVLDFGFFGFMFNDLGDNYKFSYDDFTNIEKEKGNQNSDNIKANNEAASSTISPLSGDSPLSDNENNPPKKRRKISSTNLRDSKTKTTDEEKISKVESLPYVDFQQVVLSSKSANHSGCSGKLSPIFVISLAVLEFFTTYKYLPRHTDETKKQEDLKKLKQNIESIKKSMNLIESLFKKLPLNWSDNIYGSFSPVCAVIGGVAGQDMIRALSEKGIPTHNTFTFDGLSMNGTVHKIGFEASKLINVEPVVRDFFQIDDDDD